VTSGCFFRMLELVVRKLEQLLTSLIERFGPNNISYIMVFISGLIYLLMASYMKMQKTDMIILLM